MFSSKEDLKKITNNNKQNNKNDNNTHSHTHNHTHDSDSNNEKHVNANGLEQNVPMKICGNESDPETYYCYNNVVNMGENFMMRLTTLRSCDKNQDKTDTNLYCKYYEECVKPNNSKK